MLHIIKFPVVTLLAP